jgi:hypothetical protein
LKRAIKDFFQYTSSFFFFANEIKCEMGDREKKKEN